MNEPSECAAHKSSRNFRMFQYSSHKSPESLFRLVSRPNLRRWGLSSSLSVEQGSRQRDHRKLAAAGRWRQLALVEDVWLKAHRLMVQRIVAGHWAVRSKAATSIPNRR